MWAWGGGGRSSSARNGGVAGCDRGALDRAERHLARSRPLYRNRRPRIRSGPAVRRAIEDRRRQDRETRTVTRLWINSIHALRTIGIDVVDRIVQTVRVGIPALRVSRIGSDVSGIGRHEPSISAGVEPRHGVIVTRFGIPVIRGELLVVVRCHEAEPGFAEREDAVILARLSI